MKTKYYILAVLLFCANCLFAQDIKFVASVSKNEVGTGEQFELTFSVNGNGDHFSPPNLSRFVVLSGPNQSTSMTSINGNTTVSNSISYVLMAAKEGDYIIGPAFVIVNGSRLATNGIRLKVVKGQPVQQQNNQGQSTQDNSVMEGNTADISKSLFLRAATNKTTVYQGEQLSLNYRLYTRVGIVDSRVDKLPDLNGFYNEDVKTPQQQRVQWRTETYKGSKYNVADVKQTILFAEHSGNIKIDPFEMTFIARLAAPSRDIMDQFFGDYKDVKYQAKSIPLVIHVKPLPEAGKPAGFAGAVGHFTIETTVDKTELKANESLNYQIKISGSGNIKLLKALTVNFPPDFEKYDPKVTDTVTENENGVTGSRIYNYLLIPRHQGNYTIDPVQFSYFNPVTQKYVSVSSKSFQVKVNKGLAEKNVTSLAADNQRDVKLLAKDIRYIKTGRADLSTAGDPFYGSVWYVLLLAAGPLLCVAAFVYRNWNRKNNSDVVKVKNRRAGKEAAKHLANAEKQLASKNTKEFYDAIFKGMYGYLSDKLNLSAADLNKETIASNLKLRAVNDQLISKLLDTLDLCEMGRYAPVTLSEQEVFEKAKSIINEIENEI
ncbi:BatD family protein [Pedobacter sp. L105]|uniref:BatD family protein n=1 Tax=Pedobacter sp. L105 TaxID=1641871 RepID=UPI00131B7485|nr:BatD family protein [Pedobacter sp. L105]